MDYLVIGAGPAGVIAADALRKADTSAAVTVIGDEPEPPYSRMALPYFLTKQVDESGTYLRRDAAHFERNAIDIRRQTVSSVDPKARHVTLASGDNVVYDKLLVATGSRPIAPPIPGMDLEGVFSVLDAG